MDEKDARAKLGVGGDGYAFGSVAHAGSVLADELDAARAESARLRAHLAAARRRKEADRARLAELEKVAGAAQELIRQFDDPPFLIGDNGGGVDEFGGPIDKLRTALAPKDDR